jgi:cardiolipin synthase
MSGLPDPRVHNCGARSRRSGRKATGELLTGDALFPPVATREEAIAGLLYSVPTAAPSEAERLLVLSIAGARRSFYIANAYFVPNGAGQQLLSNAARRGVDVRSSPMVRKPTSA